MEEKNKKDSVGYHIDGTTFYNPFLAFLHGAHNKPHDTPNFVCYDDVFKKLDWTQEPSESVRDLIDARTQQLSKTYQKIILAFSGGTDSITVYNSFIRQNIFIDEIIISYSPYTEAHPVANADWLIKNHPQAHTKITVLNRNDPKFYTLYTDDKWILENQGNLRYFNLSAPGPYFYQHCEDTWGNENWCMIVGYEKPHILRENNQWLAVHLDKVVQPSLSWPRVEFFFVSPNFPKLHVKQNHMLLRYIKKTYKDFHEGWCTTNYCGKKNNIDYIQYAAACGLDQEVTPGQGWMQKKFNADNTIKDIQLIMNNQFDNITTIDPVLKEKLIGKDSIAKNFIGGWQSLQNDQTLIEYMMRHGLLSKHDQSVENYNGMWGEKYLLEDQ